MILLFEDITWKLHHYTICDTSWFQPENDNFLLAATARISVSRRDKQTVLLKGSLEGLRLAACDRCREEVKEALYCEFEYLVTTSKEQLLDSSDVECSEKDAITLSLNVPGIDVDEILREQAYLAFPLKTLCDEDCKGICAGCGVVLNSEVCQCPSEGFGSTFAILKKLTNK